MLRHCLVAAGILLAFFPSTVLAQVADDEEAAYRSDLETQPFTGPKVEAIVGTDGDLLYGFAIGFDFQVRGIVLGVEGEISDSDESGCVNFSTQLTACWATTRDLYVGGRIGVPIIRNTLVYGKVGYSSLRRRLRLEENGTTTFRANNDFDSVRLGVGIEQRIGARTYVKGEYRFTDFAVGQSHAGVLGFGLRF